MKNQSINLIAAVSQNYVIGNKQGIPWYLPSDFKHFKTTTLNSRVVMGRKTFESIGKPLPNRENIVLSSSMKEIEGVKVQASLKIEVDKPTFFIGGSSIYKDCLEFCDTLYITKVLKDVNGDTFFPYSFPYIESIFYKEEGDIMEENDTKFQFITYKRK